ncbi:hypothetical protein [Lysinibacillus sp. JNUCC 51]|uniref:hypothetical protein n=1 Tax=Lysinibacillus sp. JNUCC-51 TaxID=2792479 RepID=UPI00193734B1|nr:hypothetical protein JNUCC51_10575 [Lysinibacillus sp. JNUCC-51]
MKAKRQRQQKGFILCESEAAMATAPMLVTKALSQDVMVLAIVPLLLIPTESPSLYSNRQMSSLTFDNELSILFLNFVNNFIPVF